MLLTRIFFENQFLRIFFFYRCRRRTHSHFLRHESEEKQRISSSCFFALLQLKTIWSIAQRSFSARDGGNGGLVIRFWKVEIDVSSSVQINKHLKISSCFLSTQFQCCCFCSSFSKISRSLLSSDRNRFCFLFFPFSFLTTVDDHHHRHLFSSSSSSPSRQLLLFLSFYYSNINTQHRSSLSCRWIIQNRINAMPYWYLSLTSRLDYVILTTLFIFCA